MKKTLFFFLLSLFSMASFAQIKKDTLTQPKRVITESEVNLKGKSDKDTALSYAEEFKRDAVRFKWGIRGAALLNRMNTVENEIVRIQSNGLPLLENNKIVRDKLANNTGLNTGFSIGIFGRLSRGSFFFQPEILYASKGGKFDILQSDGKVYKRVEGSFKTIDIPLLLGLRFRKGRIFGGPVTSFALSSSESIKTALANYTNQDVAANFFKKPILLLQGGLGFEFEKFFIDVRYERSLSSYSKLTIGPSSNPAPFNFTSNSFIFSIGMIQ